MQWRKVVAVVALAALIVVGLRPLVEEVRQDPTLLLPESWRLSAVTTVAIVKVAGQIAQPPSQELAATGRGGLSGVFQSAAEIRLLIRQVGDDPRVVQTESWQHQVVHQFDVLRRSIAQTGSFSDGPPVDVTALRSTLKSLENDLTSLGDYTAGMISGDTKRTEKARKRMSAATEEVDRAVRAIQGILKRGE